MNKFFTLITILLFTINVIAQVPQKMSYQAVVRDASGKLVSNHAVSMRVSILQGTTPVFVETHNTNSNLNGLISIEIGNGTFVQGVAFQSIDWSEGTYFIKTETDPTGGTNYTAIEGTSQLLSVPFALHANTAETFTGTLPETDPIFFDWDKTSGIEIVSSQVTDFQSAVTNNEAVLANTAKNSYPAEDAAKLAAISGINTGDQVLPTLKSLGAVAGNTAITGATKTKISYDSKGLVISGTDATTADITPSTDRNYVSDVQQAILENTSGINTGDETSTSIKTKLGITILSGDNTGDQDLSSKVDKIAGKGLSTNDYTTDEQSKLAGIASGAEVNIQADWNQEDNTKDDFIKNKPLNVSLFTNDAVYLKASNNLSDVLNTESARTNLGLGTIATQQSNAVAISGGSLNGTTIGGTTPSTGSFTILGSNGNTVLGDDASDVIDVKGSLRIESGTPAAGKVLTSDASGNATWKTSTTTTVEITRSRFLLTSELGAYIINGQSLEENIDINDYRNQFIAPFDGKLAKIVLKTDSPMGNTVIKMMKNHNATIIESQTVNVAAANTAYTFTFTAASFLAGDDLEIYVDPTSIGVDGCKVSFSIVWQY